MQVLDAVRQRARLIIGPILGITLVAYFAYHLVQGDRGLVAWLRLNEEIRVARATLDDVDGQLQPLQHRVSLMRDHIDRDLLDERARAGLNLVGPGEVVIFNSPATPNAAASSR
jgi:cell division protein FtsB